VKKKPFDDPSRVVYFHILSWVNCGIGTHYYGTLEQYGGDRVDVKHVIDAEEAEKLNDEDEWRSYEEGDESGRYYSKEDVIADARRVWKERFPDADILILGDHGTAQPQEVLEGPDGIKGPINDFYQQMEDLDFDWDAYPTEMEAIEEAWNEIWGWPRSTYEEDE